MKSNCLCIQPSQLKIKSTPIVYENVCLTPKEVLKYKVDEFLQELANQVETLEDALSNEQSTNEKYQRGVYQLEKENTKLAEKLAFLEGELRNAQSELDALKSQNMSSHIDRRKSFHISKTSKTLKTSTPSPKVEYPLYQSQVKSLQDLCNSQEKLIRKCLQSLQHKRSSAEKLKKEILMLKEEKTSLHHMIDQEHALIEAAKEICEDELDSDESCLSGSPSPMLTASRKDSLEPFLDLANYHLDRLGKLTQEQHHKPPRLHFLSVPATRPVSPRPYKDESVTEIKQVLKTNNEMLQSYITKLKCSKRRTYSTCWLSRRVSSQMFLLKL